MRRELLAYVLLALGTLTLYAPVGTFDFLGYDDPMYARDNPRVLAGPTHENIRWAFTTFESSNWFPLTRLSHMLDARLFPGDPGRQHLVNVFFHTINSLLVFLFLRRATGAFWRSLMVAALFAWHALHVESVAWISERKDVLSTLFALLTMLAYLSYTRRKSWIWYALMIALYALALMCKPMVVTLPCVLLLLDFWPLARRGSRVILEKIPLFAMSAAGCVVTYAAQRTGGAVQHVDKYTLAARLGNAAVAYARYLSKTFCPVNLAIFYPHPGHWPAWQIASSVALLVVITAIVIWRWRAEPYLPVGWFWFIGTLVPTIGLIQVGWQSMADRYTYFPHIGLFIAIVWTLARMVEHHPHWQRPVAAGCGLALAGCVVATSVYLPKWRDTFDLFEHALNVTDNNWFAHDTVGRILLDRGDYQAAHEHLRQAIDYAAPDYEINWRMGKILVLEKFHAQAIPYYQRALKIAPDMIDARNELGLLYLGQNRYQEAAENFRELLKRLPTSPEAHGNLAVALTKLGDIEGAAREMAEAKRLKDDPNAVHGIQPAPESPK